MERAYRAAVMTVSDSVAQGTRQDISGPAVAAVLKESGWEVRSSEVVPDDFNLLRERLEALSSDVDVDAIFTTGGTGLGPRDRTPEATTSVMERSIAGLAELMRREGLKKTPLAALSRGVVGVKGKTLLVNLPGAPEGAEDSLRAIVKIIPHAVDVVRGEAHGGGGTGKAEQPSAPASTPAAAEPAEPVTQPETAGDADARPEADSPADE